MKPKLTILFLSLTVATMAQVSEVVPAEYNCAYLKDSIAHTAFWINGTGLKVVPYAGGHRFVEANGGLYLIDFRKANGDVYYGDTKSLNLKFLQHDTLGIPFKAIAIECWMNTHIAVRHDGTIWSAGANSPGWFGPNRGVVLTRWAKIPGQPVVKFKSVTYGGGQLIAIADDGSVYTLADNSTSWVKKILPGPAKRVFASDNYFYIALVSGQPFGWGEGKYLGLAPGRFTTPVSLKSALNLTGAVADLAVNHNTIHFIDSEGRLFGMGDNAQGEVGDGWELVNKEEYDGKQYVWDWDNANMVSYQQISFVSKPVHIRPDVKFKRVWGGGTYTFYKYAQDVAGNLYSWGRNKGACPLSNGVSFSNLSTYPNAGDVLIPTLVNLNWVIAMPYEFIPGKVSAGKDTAVESSSVRLNGAFMPSGSKSFVYDVIGFQWSRLSGPDCTILYPHAIHTDVNFKSPGTYSFQLLLTDKNTGTMADTVVVTVTIPNKPPTVEAFCKTTIGKSIILVGKASDADGTITATEWDKISGPAGDAIIDIVKDAAQISFTQPGEYVYRFNAFDDKGASSSVDVTLIVYEIEAGGYIIIRKK